MAINSEELCIFIKGIPYFQKKYFVDKIILCGYYLQKKEIFDFCAKRMTSRIMDSVIRVQSVAIYCVADFH